MNSKALHCHVAFAQNTPITDGGSKFMVRVLTKFGKQRDITISQHPTRFRYKFVYIKLASHNPPKFSKAMVDEGHDALVPSH
jgi:hypothetical protein